MYCTLINIQQWRCFIDFAPTVLFAMSLTAVSNELNFLQSGFKLFFVLVLNR